MNEVSKRNVVVAMSGGVDSSVAAAILKSKGYNVIGITMQLYDEGKFSGKKGACCAGQDVYDAQIAADILDIPHYVLNYESVFKKNVIDDFVDSYMHGETPVPCIKCNQKVKFQDLLSASKDLGADFLATGHYVRKVKSNIGGTQAEIHKGVDALKDQSYFLFTINKEQLNFLEFPIGEINKAQTREIARSYKLNVSEKPDSQDICFVQGSSYKEFIRKWTPEASKPGDITLSSGEVIGRHQGIIGYTIGQRQGIGVSSKVPLYVLSINPESNTIIVGAKEELASNMLKIRELNWLGAGNLPKNGTKLMIRLRSMHKECEAVIDCVNEDGTAVIYLTEPYIGVAPGQACVFYEGTRLLGGGWISR